MGTTVGPRRGVRGREGGPGRLCENPPDRMAEIHSADPTARRNALVLIGAAALAGAVLILIAGAMRSRLEEWVVQDLNSRLWLVLIVAILFTTGPALGAAGYLWRLGARVVRARRYPPPELRMLRDTLVVTDDAAVRAGRLLQALAATIGLGGILLAYFLWRLVSLLQRGFE